MKKILKKVPVALICAVYAWLIFSFVEVNIKNSNPNPQYCPMNLFVLADKYIEPIW